MNKITLVVAIIALILSVCALFVASTKTIATFGGTTVGSWIAGEDLQSGDDTIVGDDLNVSGLATITETLAVTGKTTLTDDVTISTTTAVTDLTVYDATATSTIYIKSGGASKGGQIVIEQAGGGCVALRFNAQGCMTTTTIACGQTTGFGEY